MASTPGILMARQKSTKKNDALALKVLDLKNRIRVKLIKEMSEDLPKYEREQKFPWEGRWLRKEQIIECQKRMKRRDRIVFIEIIILFGSMLGLSFLVLVVTGILMPT